MLDENYSVVKQKKIIAKIYNIINSDILTPEYNNNIEELNKLINENDSEEMIELEQQIINNINNYNNSYKSQILESKMSFNNKVISYKFLKIMESYNNSSSNGITIVSTTNGIYQNTDLLWESINNIADIDSQPWVRTENMILANDELAVFDINSNIVSS